MNLIAPSIFDIVIPVKHKLFQYGAVYLRDLSCPDLLAYPGSQNGIPIVESTGISLKPLIHKNKPLVAYGLNMTEQFNNLQPLGKLAEK